MANHQLGQEDRLYELLPAIYRERDEAEGYPLRALLRVVQAQAGTLQADIQELWNNFFIETCKQWVIPYIGDLVGNNLLHDTSRSATPDTARTLFPDLVGRDLRPEIAIRTRADVARTIYYRRRKGTLPMLEELARDVTGWAAHAVAFFELLNWTQHLNHRRPQSLDCPDLRSVESVDRLNRPFDTMSHTVDVRTIGQTEGWYNIRNIGFFLWRLWSYPAENVAARKASQPWQYHCSPLGNPAPLFSRWRREGDEAGLATELHVPGPIRPAAFYEDLRLHSGDPDHTDFYGLLEPFPNSSMKPCPDCSLVIIRDGKPVLPGNVLCMNLSSWHQPTGQVVGVDVERGRLAFGTDWQPERGVDVSYHYGFSADLGGGPYKRGKWLVRPEHAALHLRVSKGGGLSDTFPTLSDALVEWSARGKPNTIITILDNRTYAESMTLDLTDNAWLVIEAANEKRPHVQGGIDIVGHHAEAELTLSGLLIEGAVHVFGDLGRLRLLHTTLVPGRGIKENGDPFTREPNVIAEGKVKGTSKTDRIINTKLRVEIAFSITGPIRLPTHADGLWVLDSIIDGFDGKDTAAVGTSDQPGPPTTLERVTIFGRCYVKKLPLASEVIFTEPVIVTQCQEGCVRFSFVPQEPQEESKTPRRYRCQPDLEIATQIEEMEKTIQASKTKLTQAELDKRREAIRTKIQGWLVPSFTASHYGHPRYAQLRLVCPLQIRTGAEDGAEMGAFSHLKQPQRETNLRIRLEEYLPFGLDAGLLYVT